MQPSAAPTPSTFSDLNLAPALLSAVQAEGYSTPTPIQREAIPRVLEGRDVLGIAQTGTGKTAAFALPILQRLAGSHLHPRKIRCLVLSPTRELAAQIGESFGAYGRHAGLRHTVIFGGVGQGGQEAALRRGIDILVATPGRLLDLMNQGHVRLDGLEIFVLDEADRMLDMGFIHDVRRVVAALPRVRQTLFFSATMPKEVQALADGLLRDPARVEVTPVATTVEKVTQQVFMVERGDKRALLEQLLRDHAVRRVLVFTRTKHGANRLAEQLTRSSIPALAIHGNKSQGARERALAGFKSGATRVLVATDIAARGIDVEGITHVVNFDLPNVPEDYVHRIGRTARAGASGVAWSLCDTEERAYLRDIERTIRMRVPTVDEHPFKSSVPMSIERAPAPRQNAHGGRSGGGPQRSHTPRTHDPSHRTTGQAARDPGHRHGGQSQHEASHRATGHTQHDSSNRSTGHTQHDSSRRSTGPAQQHETAQRTGGHAPHAGAPRRPQVPGASPSHVTYGPRPPQRNRSR